VAGQRAVRRHLLPQRHDLFRQADAGDDTEPLRAADETRRAAVRRPFREFPLCHAGVPAARQDRVRTEPAARCGRDDAAPGAGWQMSIVEEQFASNLYFDRTFACDAAKILPGEYYCTDRDMVIVTVLGSCVSACIRDVKSGIGGMNHFMLPEGGMADKDNPVSASMRYGSYAMEVLINRLLKQGARRENLEAKIFGGGN